MAQQLAPYTFTGQSTLFQTLTNNTSSTNADFGNTFIQQYSLELVHKFPALFSEQTFYLQTFPSQQFYQLPLQVRKINTVVVNVGNSNGTTTSGAGFNWPVKECPTMEYWNVLNMTNNITSDIPLYYFFYNGQLGIYPKPADGYNPITIRAQVETVATSQADYTTGTIASVPYALALTASPTLGATSLSLTGVWSLPTGTYQILFSDSENILATMTNGSAIVALQNEIIGTPNYPLALTAAPATGATTATLTTAFTLTTGTYTMTFSDGENIQATLTNGLTTVTLATAITGSPNSVVYINSSTGTNVVNITTAVTFRTAQGGDIVTGTGTSWNASMVGYMFRISQTQAANGGDGYPYTVQKVYDTTHLALNTSYGGTAISAASAAYTMGQISIIPTSYQLIPVYRTCERYYRVIVKDKELAKAFGDDADKLFAQMEIDYGNKDTDPTVQDDFGTPIVNPNLALNTTQSTGL